MCCHAVITEMSRFPASLLVWLDSTASVRERQSPERSINHASQAKLQVGIARRLAAASAGLGCVALTMMEVKVAEVGGGTQATIRLAGSKTG
jgi:hypothetical protein